MAELKDIRATVAALADDAISARGECERKIGYETWARTEYDTSLAQPGLCVTFKHHATDIVELHVRPQGLADGAVKLYRLTVSNGGFRSMVTYGRISAILAAFGFGIARREGRAAEAGDQVFAKNHAWNVALHRSVTVWFDAAGEFEDSRDDGGRAYPDGDEIAALDWLRAGIEAGEETATSVLAETFREARANDPGHMGSPGIDAEGRADYLYGRHVSRSYRLSTFNGMRRSCFAQHYGKPESRAALDFLLEQWREAGSPDPAKARRHRFPVES